jgi:hypothetical protein
MALRGFQTVSAMVMVSELGGAWRFDHPRQLMCYLGLVPTENSSGSRRRQGAIWLRRSARASGLRPAFGCRSRLRPSARLQSRQQSRPLVTDRGGAPLPPAAEDQQGTEQTTGVPEPGDQRLLLESANPAASPNGEALRAGQTAEQSRRRRGARTRRVRLGRLPAHGTADEASAQSGSRREVRKHLSSTRIQTTKEVPTQN